MAHIVDMSANLVWNRLFFLELDGMPLMHCNCWLAVSCCWGTQEPFSCCVIVDCSPSLDGAHDVVSSSRTAVEFITRFVSTSERDGTVAAMLLRFSPGVEVELRLVNLWLRLGA